jgi:hypothetical protein
MLSDNLNTAHLRMYIPQLSLLPEPFGARWLTGVASTIAAVIISLNIKLIFDAIGGS